MVGYILYKQKTSYLYIIWVFDLLKTKNKMSGFFKKQTAELLKKYKLSCFNGKYFSKNAKTVLRLPPKGGVISVFWPHLYIHAP